MGEIKVGNYVRTEDGAIGKITKIVTDSIFYVQFYDMEPWKTDIEEAGIVKSSPNIIDLIEVGDLICYWYDDNYIHDWVKQFADKELIEYLKLECNEAIKWVATKEQIESIKYEV